MTRDKIEKYLGSDVEVILRDGTIIMGGLYDCYCNDNLCYFCVCNEKVVDDCTFDSSDIKEINRIKIHMVKINGTIHAKWNFEHNSEGFAWHQCSNCDNRIIENSTSRKSYPYCPFCGAKMDKE